MPPFHQEAEPDDDPLTLPVEPAALREALSALAQDGEAGRTLLVRLCTSAIGMCDSEMLGAVDAAADARRQELKQEAAEAKRIHREAEAEAKARETEARREARHEEVEERRRVKEEEKAARAEERKRKRGGGAAQKRESKGAARDGHREASPAVSAARREAWVGAAARKGVVVGGGVEGPLTGEEAYEGSWYEGIVVELPEKGRALVNYGGSGEEGGESGGGVCAPLLCLLPLECLRPLPPARPPPSLLERTLRSAWGMPVEVRFEGGWWEAELLGACGGAWAAAERGGGGGGGVREVLGVGSRVRATKVESEWVGKSGMVVHAGSSGEGGGILEKGSIQAGQKLNFPAG